MKVLCTICARGGSKGVPNKNIRTIAGKPLVAYSIGLTANSKLIDRVVVSTDSEKIADIARKFGAEVPFMRPSCMAQDSSAKFPVIKHAVKHYIEELNFFPDIVVDLDATAPLIVEKDIKNCLDRLQNNDEVDSVLTGYKSDVNPYFNMVEIQENGYARISKKGDKIFTSRQEAPIVYAMAPIVAWKIKKLLESDVAYSGRIKLIEMPQKRALEIDSETDFKFAEFLLKQKDL